MPDSIINSVVVQSVDVALLHFIWQGALVGVLTALVFVVLQHRSANSRYVIACGALLIMVVLPVWTAVGHAGRQATNSGQGQSSGVAGFSKPRLPTRSDLAAGRAIPTTRDDAAPQPVPAVALPPALWLPVGAAVWFAVVLVLSLRLGVSWLVAIRLCSRGTRTLAEDWRRRVIDLSARLRVSRSVRVVESTLVRVLALRSHPSGTGTLLRRHCGVAVRRSDCLWAGAGRPR